MTFPVDPWLLLTVLFALLWVVELRFGGYHRYMAGKLAGYDMASRECQIRTAEEPLRMPFQDLAGE